MVLGVKIADKWQVWVFRGVKFAVDGLEIFALVGSHLLFARRHLSIGVYTEQNFSQPFARQESRVGAFQFYFFQLLPPLAFEFSFGKRGFARQFVHQAEQGLREFRKPGKRNRAGVRARTATKIRAD